MELKIIGSGSKGNGYVLDAGNEALVIECGVKLLEVKRAVGFNLSKIVGCIVTHQHNDHAGYAKEYCNAGLLVLALQEVITAKGLENAKAITIGRGYIMRGFKVLPFMVKHDVPCVGYLIQHKQCGKVVFITDTYAMPYDIEGINYWMIEANYADDILEANIERGKILPVMRDRLLLSHMEISNTIGVLQRSDLSQTKSIVLVHLSDGNSNANRFVEDVKRATGKPTCWAKNGTVLPFDLCPL